MSLSRRRSILAKGLARTNRCDWTAAASLSDSDETIVDLSYSLSPASGVTKV